MGGYAIVLLIVMQRIHFNVIHGFTLLITKIKFQIVKMITQKSLKTGFQVLAFGLFIFQMQGSMRKYFYGPTTHVKSQKHISQTQVNLLLSVNSYYEF